MNVKIEKLVYGGEGLAHHEGQTVFVPFVLPEEIVTVRPVERKKKFVRGRVLELLAPSPDRAAPPCPHFTVCGGCHYQHIPYEAQVRYKSEILRETLWRIGRVKWGGAIEAHASPPLRYRNRAQWKIRQGGENAAAANPTSSCAGGPGIGYFRAGSTALCPVEACPILSPRLEEVLGAFRRLLGARALPDTLREVEAFVDAGDEKVLLNVSLASFVHPPAALAATLRDSLPGTESILLHESSRDRFELFGPGFLSYAVAGHPYRVGHLSFFQVNRFVVEPMVEAVAAEEPGATALDLFAGVGLFTVPLVRRFRRVVAVESSAAAARDLEANCASSSSVQAVNAEVEQFLNDWSDTPDCVLLDPPRAGVPEAVLRRLRALAPARILYFSCDPSTLARDLAPLTGAPQSGGDGRAAAGTAYRIREVHLFDAFPQTFHIESLVRLARVE